MLLFEPLLVLLLLILTSLGLQYFVNPKTAYSLRPSGLMLHCLLITGGYGWLLLASGSSVFAAVLTASLVLACVIASNLKWKVLGEPLVFSDLSVIKECVKHPKFYIFAVPVFIRLLVSITLLSIPAGYIWALTQPCPPPIRLLAFFLAVIPTLCLAALPAKQLLAEPDLEKDIAHFGLAASLFLYWRCWQEQHPATAPETQPASPAFDLVVVIQCESFTDPRTLSLPPETPLPPMHWLTKSREMASNYGKLDVSGFGAYTIRSEYGVLFGRSEQELGFQKFDPFLTAKNEKLFSLPYKLGISGFTSVFLHPYTLDFSNRRSLMAHIGFDTVLGAEAFPHSSTPEMPYVSDKHLAEKIISLCSETHNPLFLYAVTIENHGPWQEKGQPLTSYLEHLKNSDDMIGQLIKALTAMEKTALLVFFGDHRPSIPPVLSPGPERDTPYFAIQFAKQKPEKSLTEPDSRTPAELHHLIEQYSLKYRG